MMRRQTPRASCVTLIDKNGLMHPRNKMSMRERENGSGWEGDTKQEIKVERVCFK